MRERPSKLTVGQQVLAMRRRFPAFSYQRVNGVPTWVGILQPDPSSAAYRVQVRYCPPRSPRVRVLAPVLRPNFPHHYADGSLCVYHPPDASWTPSKFIADTIVPWAAYWLACYELWLPTGEWYGPEAPHSRHKQQD
jgi:hypothetical protein